MKKAAIGYFEALDYSGNEALNTVCSNLSFAGRDLKKIVVTSCNAGDGKSYMTMQIAKNLAKRGKKVVVVDADLRMSLLIKKYRLKTTGEWVGLAHYLAGLEKLENVLYSTDLNNFYVIPIGREISNPMPLLDTHNFSDLLDVLAENFDLVLVDAPPIGLVIDAAVIAQSCDGAIFVVEYNKTRRREMLNAKRQMQQSECPIVGCIINKMKYDTLSAKRYSNGAYYNQYNNDGPRKPRAQAPRRNGRA